MLVMTTPPERADTAMRGYVITAGHHNADHEALAINDTVVAHYAMSFTPNPTCSTPADPSRAPDASRCAHLCENAYESGIPTEPFPPHRISRNVPGKG